MTSLKKIFFWEIKIGNFPKTHQQLQQQSVSAGLFCISAHSEQHKQGMHTQNAGTFKPVCLVRSHFLNRQNLILKEKKVPEGGRGLRELLNLKLQSKQSGMRISPLAFSKHIYLHLSLLAEFDGKE